MPDELAEYLRRDAAYRAMGGRGHLISGGAETDAEKAAREAQEAEAAAAAEAERERAAEAERAREAAEAALPEGARTALAAARREAREAQQALRDAQRVATEATTERDRLAAAEREREQAQMGELERAQAQVAEEKQAREAAEARVRATALRAEVMGVGARLNLHDPMVALRLLDEAEVQRDADGNPTNVEALLKALAEKHPYLVKAAGKDGIPPTPDGGSGPMTDEEKRKAAGTRLVRPRL